MSTSAPDNSNAATQTAATPSTPQPACSTSACSVPESAPLAPAADDEIDIDHFARVKIRIATVEAVEPLPKSKKLYKIQVDVGELGKRQIVSGIALHYTPEQLVGKQIAVIVNLKPAKLMGVESQGMLLAASTEGDTALALLTPDKEIAPGSRVR